MLRAPAPYCPCASVMSWGEPVFCHVSPQQCSISSKTLSIKTKARVEDSEAQANPFHHELISLVFLTITKSSSTQWGHSPRLFYCLNYGCMPVRRPLEVWFCTFLFPWSTWLRVMQTIDAYSTDDGLPKRTESNQHQRDYRETTFSAQKWAAFVLRAMWVPWRNRIWSLLSYGHRVCIFRAQLLSRH